MLMMFLFFIVPCCVVLFELLSAYISIGFILMLLGPNHFRNFSAISLLNVQNYKFCLFWRRETIYLVLSVLSVSADQK